MVDYESLEPKFSERRSTAFKWKTTWNFQRKQILQFLRQTEWEASWNTLLAAVVYTFGRNFTWPTSDHKLNSQFPLDTLTKQLAKIFSILNSSRGDLIPKFKFVNQTWTNKNLSTNRVASEGNSLPDKAVNCPTVNNFKNNLDVYLKSSLSPNLSKM